MLNFRRYAVLNDKIIVAHRGASGDYPENTIPAFENAIKQKADAVEADIQITKDGKLVAFHDETISTGEKKSPVSSLTYSELMEVNSQKINNNNFNIPLLDEVLEVLKDRAYLVLEVKSYTSGDKTREIDELLSVLRKHGYSDKTLIASFNYRLLRTLKEMNSELLTAAIKIPGEDTPPAAIMDQCGCTAFICGAGEMTTALSQHFKKHKITAGLYGVDSKAIFNKVKNYYLKAYGTNYPGLINQILND